MTYSDALLTHFRSPRNVGDLTEPDAEAEAENPVCGDRLRMQFRLESGVVREVRWRAEGCPPAIASASAASELLTGMGVERARALDRAAIENALGGLPPRKGHAALLVLQVIGCALSGPEGHDFGSRSRADDTAR